MKSIDMHACTRTIHDLRATQRVKSTSYPVVVFDNPARDRDELSTATILLLQDIMLKVGLESVRVTSTVRDENEQAAAMYSNLKAGKTVNYGPAGTSVQRVGRAGISAGDSASSAISNMAAEILRVGPSKVSHHAPQGSIETFDLSYKSMNARQRAAFVSEVRSILAKDGPIVKFGHPGGKGRRKEFYEEPAFHLEVQWPKGDFPVPAGAQRLS